MERTKGLKEYIQTKEYRESLGLSGQVTETYTMLAQGEYNRNYTFTHPITGQKLVLRINFGSQMHLKDQILYEYRALKLLENSGRTPKAIYADGSCKNLPYGVMVMEFLPGHSLDYKTELFSAAGCLADIHSVKMPETHSLIQPKEPLKAILEECEAMVKTYMESELGDEQKKRRIRSLLDQGWKAVENLETDIPYHCCINTELNSTNFLVNDRNVDGRRINENSVGEKKNYEFAITAYESGEQLCEEQSALEACQLLFLDINMQGMDGLKTAMRIKEKYPKLPVVLVTAYMNYALDGYKVKASRFLLKDNLADTIEECMDDLIAEINKNRRILEFRFVEGTIKLYADDIIYIETELHKNVFYTEKGTFQIYKKLDELENEFKDMGFVRAHLSFLVNMRYITKISGYVMTLTTGKKIPVPKARYAQVKREYMLYKGEE